MAALTIDYANCLSDRVGEHGFPVEAIDTAADELTALTRRLNASRGTGWERWRLLPFDPMRSEHVNAVRAIADEFAGRVDNLVVLGIGGSALGNIALQNALNPLTWNFMPADRRRGPRLFVLDNVDPHLVAQVIIEVERSDPTLERTLVNVISKSGETAETAAQFMIFRELLERKRGGRAKEHVVAVTDPEKGTMREICDDAGYRTLPVPEGVGGRFSVLSPVGLFSAAMCGIDIDALLDGAAAMDERCQTEAAHDNPAAILAHLLVGFIHRGKPNHVLMPYCNQLYSLADWFRQLWAESLGKKDNIDGEEVFAGGTPIKALGTTDQHSQVQLYREGPNDKVIGFVEVQQWSVDVRAPDDPPHANLRYLAGRSLGDLIAAEKLATKFALVQSRRPNFTITLPQLDAASVGGFIQLWEITTAYAGLMLGINAYDQPAVETGKVATFGLMGRTGFDEWGKRVTGALAPSPHRV